MKVLVVEDCHFTQRIVHLHLQKHGFETHLCCQGEEALSVLEVDPAYDLIVSDIVMPVMGGLELLAEVKRRPQLSTIPFILLTGKQDSETVQKAVQMGCCAYILKPVNPGIMMAQIKQVLGQESEWEVRPGGSYASKATFL